MHEKASHLRWMIESEIPEEQDEDGDSDFDLETTVHMDSKQLHHWALKARELEVELTRLYGRLAKAEAIFLEGEFCA